MYLIKSCSVQIELTIEMEAPRDSKLKELCIENPIVKSQYGTADNPILTVFCLENAHAVIADFSGRPPRDYNF